ncbi:MULTISPECIES: orotidine-5'-phosphate decarboxylase [Idiomarina]|jgi:orotidine-5'-phosphate decarboxylase|uniref:orotidine-5'-phosphate decarboxylase n=1 Tax=Idiomarina TaxID=135575 RepID=UPI000C351E4F|nr:MULTISPECIES: orotidine-5'-phosphate decarboxylase [Idiomarina]MAO67265.1 orotidine-5'-phosphate decarboxylase [Idiomarina sp.]MBE92656.1 orotidine-5'-phosphate decarboxylase [Idiomarina sp.]MBF80063.1 orotidine-5'-phosphate decarboxylase [Idiomarina sp.]|tara:strand:- start:29620 stop:30315 length:696 start_codon:yes stop_codon:yes gene_type:complete
MALPKIYVALDCQTQEEADQLVSRLPSGQVGLKVGKELFTSIGPEWVRKQVEQGFSIFLDLKFHDIPNTVAKAVTSAAKIGVDIVNVHASGGSDMMKAAKDALEPFDNPPLLIAVTVLTSMSDADLADIGIQVTAEQQVLNLAKLTQKAGLDGVVCSAQEARMLKDALGESFKLVTPGIRPANSATDDQKRVMTPKEAILAGVDYMVIGRPITRSENPEETVAEILASIGE